MKAITRIFSINICNVYKSCKLKIEFPLMSIVLIRTNPLRKFNTLPDEQFLMIKKPKSCRQ
jgi:hypothetical protein